MRSWESRERPRTRRPKPMMGATIKGTPMKQSAASLGLVTIIITTAPVAITRLRSATEADDPTTVCTSVVSAVSRDSTSPVRVVSKKLGLKLKTWREDLAAHIGGDALADPGDRIETTSPTTSR